MPYKLTSTHTFASPMAEDMTFPTAGDAWQFAGMDYMLTDAALEERTMRDDARRMHGMTEPGSVTLTTGEVVTVTETCDCSPDDGPCEAHMETVVMRMGSAAYSADELCVRFIHDAVSIGAELSATGAATLRELDDESAWEGSWLRDPELADAMRDLTWQLESDIATLDDGPFHVTWDDGFVIYKLTGGPLADD